MNRADATLTAEELGFLREMFAGTDPVGTGAGPGRLVLDPSNGDPDLLADLLSASPLEFRAQHEDYVLRYDVEVERPATGAPIALRFGTPAIVEERLQPRYARVKPAGSEIRVAESEGRMAQCMALDISTSGMRLRTQGEPMEDLRELDLQLSVCGERLRLRAEIVRVIPGRRRRECQLAVRFLAPERAAREAINRYVLQRHPVIQANHPGEE